ncbi:hypothetical protein [Thermoleptolyngbya sp.]
MCDFWTPFLGSDNRDSQKNHPENNHPENNHNAKSGRLIAKGLGHPLLQLDGSLPVALLNLAPLREKQPQP